MDAPHSSPRAKIVFAFVLLYIVWGATYLGIRLCIREVPPFMFAGSRNLLAGLLTLAGAFLWKAPKPNARQILNAWAMGLFLFLGGNGGVAWGEQYVSTGVTSLLLGTTPFWMVFLHRLFHEGGPMRKSAWAGMALGFIGVAVLADPFSVSDDSQLDLMGCLVVLLSAVSWSFGSIWGRGRDLPSSPFVSMGIQMAGGGLGLLTVSVLSGEGTRFHWTNITTTGVTSFTYLVLFGSIAGFTAFYYVLQRKPPHVVSSYAYVNPIVAVFLGAYFLNESLGPRTILSTVFIVGGVALMLWSNRDWEKPGEAG
jgi:drug/metabolite transporter (DMT)-like permease